MSGVPCVSCGVEVRLCDHAATALLQPILSFHNGEVEQLQSDLTAAQATIAQRDAQVAALTTDRDRLRARTHELQEKHDSETRGMKKQVARYRDLFSRAGEALKQSRDGYVVIPSAWDSAMFGVLTEQLAARDAQVAALEADRDAWRKEREDVANLLYSQEGRLGALTEQLADIRMKHDHLAAIVDAQDQEDAIASMTPGTSTYYGEYAPTLTEQLAARDAEVAELTAALRDVERVIGPAPCRCDGQQEEVHQALQIIRAAIGVSPFLHRHPKQIHDLTIEAALILFGAFNESSMEVRSQTKNG